MFKPLRHSFARVLALTFLLACVPTVAHAAEASNGGTSPDDPRYAPAKTAKIVNGYAIPPKNAPRRVKKAIDAANDIVDKPYRYGGGHASVEDNGYDCSGTVSYALLAAAELGLEGPLDSGSFMKWGEAGEGQWFTIYTNPGHAYAVIAGLRLDTSIGSSPRGGDRKLAAQHKKAMERGPRWRPWERSSRGFKKRHPVGF